MSASIYDQLVGAVRQGAAFPPKEGHETTQDYLSRLLQEIAKVPEKVWDSLTDESQSWYDANVDRHAGNQEIIIPPGYEEAPAAKLTRRPVRPVSAAPTTTVFDDMKAQWMRMFGADMDLDGDQQGNLEHFVSEAHEANWVPSTDAGKHWFENARTAYNDDKTIPVPEGYPNHPAETAKVDIVNVGTGLTHTTEAEVDLTNTAVVEEPAHEPGTLPHRGHEEHKEPTEAVPAATVEAKAEDKSKKPRKPRMDKVLKPLKATKEPKPNRVKLDKTKAIRKAVTQNEKISVRDLQAQMEAQGITTTVQTLSSTRAAHLSTLKMLREMGWSGPKAAEVAENKPV